MHPTCRATTPPDGDVCGRAATEIAVFEMAPGEQRVTVCSECALRLSETARAHGTTLKLIDIVEVK